MGHEEIAALGILRHVSHLHEIIERRTRLHLHGSQSLITCVLRIKQRVWNDKTMAIKDTQFVPAYTYKLWDCCRGGRALRAEFPLSLTAI
jgi:hypothetical protein